MVSVLIFQLRITPLIFFRLMTNIILNAIKSPPGTPGPLKEVCKKKSIVNLKRKWEKKVDERTNDLKKDRKMDITQCQNPKPLPCDQDTQMVFINHSVHTNVS